MITRTAPTWHTEDWQIQLSNSISSVEELLQLLKLSAEELPAQLKAQGTFPTRVPRAFAAKMEPGNPLDPLLLQVLPQAQELIQTRGYQQDPLKEAQFNPVPGLIHKYQSRVLLTTSTTCAINCRYCFRRHFPYQDNRISQQQMQNIIDYLKQHPEVNEVIFSGGDPLATSNSRLKLWVEKLAELPQIKTLRLHTRLPVVIPERIDAELLKLMEQDRFRWVMVIHSNHAAELDAALAQAMNLLRERKVHLLNQSVLLKGVNDNAETLAALSEKLFTMGVMPYYLHLLDPVAGAAHFDLDPATATSIYQQLLALLPGYLVPKLVRETPKASSKTPFI